MKTLTVVSCLIFTAFVSISQPSERLKNAIAQLEQFYSAFPKEKVIVQTDKDYYQPAEKVWFAAWVWGMNSELAETNYSEVMIKLLASDGQAVITDKYKLNAGMVNGDLLLPANLEAGSYFLCALLPNQTDAEDVYLRQITVRPVYPNSMLISILPENEVLKKGLVINIQVKDLNGSPAKNQKLEYSITSGSQVVAEDKIKANDNGQASINFPIPENTDGTPYILSVYDNKKASVETVRLASESDQVQITFYPEGGTFVPEVPFKVGFYATDKLGNPVDIEGEITDEQNQPVINVKTFATGFGFCPFLASKNKKYTLNITNGIGKGQKFKLPPVNPNGSALTVAKLDSEFLWINSIFADNQSHEIGIVVSQKGKVYWIIEANINGNGMLKIPIKDLPQGLVLISSFSNEGFLLNQRLVNINKNIELKIDLAAIPEQIKKGEELAVNVKLSDKEGNPLEGAFYVSVSDAVCNNKVKPVLPVEWNFNTVLKNKVSTDENLYREGFDKLKFFDYFLIANELKDHDWTAISAYNPNKQKISVVESDDKFAFPANFEEKLKERVNKLNQPRLISEQVKIQDNYYAVNAGLISPKPRRSPNSLPENNSYKKFLETGTSLIEVIKVIKPFTLEGTKIIFPGGHNSLNAQGGALIVIDGQQMGEDASILNGINPHDVENISVSTSPMDIQRYTGLNSVGLIEVTTKRGKLVTHETEDNLEAVMYDGDYRIPKYFEAPKEGKLATTAFWSGQIIVDDLGKTSIKIPETNVVSEFLITVEGVGANNEFGHAVKSVKVTE